MFSRLKRIVSAIRSAGAPMGADLSVESPSGGRLTFEERFDLLVDLLDGPRFVAGTTSRPQSLGI